MNTALEEFRPSAVDEAAAAPSRLLLAAEAPRVVASIDAMLMLSLIHISEPTRRS